MSGPAPAGERDAAVEVAVVGGGPVGLALGCLLAAAGVCVRVFERRPVAGTRSRSIGLHPPALEALTPAGVTTELLARGVRVRRGHAYAGRRYLGTLRFASCPPPHRYVLTLPQGETERVLAARLCALDPGALRRGVEVTGLEAGPRGVRLTLGDGAHVVAPLAVACDGHASRVRDLLAVQVRGRDHPDRFLMGDFPDETGLGTDAAIYLTDAGVVESFPLPGGTRRWVAAADAATAGADDVRERLDGGDDEAARAAAAARLSGWVWRRVGERLDVDRCAMLSAFGVHTRLARRLALGRVALAGDAAHVIPPFGGQGMNLGWLDAAALAASVVALRRGEHLARVPAQELQRALSGYERARVRAGVAAARRAEFNLAVGRAGGASALRAALVWAGLHSPAEAVFARRFTMRGLGAGVPAPAESAPPATADADRAGRRGGEAGYRRVRRAARARGAGRVHLPSRLRALMRHPFVRHLRLPFNMLLSPVYLWGVLLGGGRLGEGAVWLGYVAVHLFLYGGTTAFNSYYDRDEGPVGGMLEPPAVTRGLLPFSLVVQALGVPLALAVGRSFTLAWLLLFLVFAAYSHPAVRLKATPFGALAAIAMGQGAVGFALGFLTSAPAARLMTASGLLGMVSTALVIVGLYVVTQSYQTLEDRRRGDRTLSVMLGPGRALRLAVGFLGAGGAVMLAELERRAGAAAALPALAFFVVLGGWMLAWAVAFDERRVARNFRVAMGLATLSASGFTVLILALLR